ncbi:Crp/Fnr family transcriptional regulator [Ahrensia sp. R2A130]|uniref:Crp/Fnr family transcriptional regulator n=1 Tax=Ahrensia sp. R2A130 TaxID=744979 RepID=UPI0018DBDAB9|nr:Crp/Fnr family transcriptional regulator [Ahrensia sp. R2A130]
MLDINLKNETKPFFEQLGIACAAARFEHYLPEHLDSLDSLIAVELTPNSYASFDNVWREGQVATVWGIVESGVFGTYSYLPDGTRHITDVHLPGDIFGLDHMFWPTAKDNMVALIPSSAVASDVTSAKRLYEAEHKFSQMFSASQAIDRLVLTERIKAMGRLSSYNCLSYLLAELASRSSLSSKAIERFDIPVSHDVLADILGLSSVHVSRQLAILQSKGFVKTGRGKITILDAASLQKAGQFRGRNVFVEHRLLASVM